MPSETNAERKCPAVQSSNSFVSASDQIKTIHIIYTIPARKRKAPVRHPEKYLAAGTRCGRHQNLDSTFFQIHQTEGVFRAVKNSLLISITHEKKILAIRHQPGFRSANRPRSRDAVLPCQDRINKYHFPDGSVRLQQSVLPSKESPGSRILLNGNSSVRTISPLQESTIKNLFTSVTLGRKYKIPAIRTPAYCIRKKTESFI